MDAVDPDPNPNPNLNPNLNPLTLALTLALTQVDAARAPPLCRTLPALVRAPHANPDPDPDPDPDPNPDPNPNQALYGLCESMYQPDLEPDDLFETLAQVRRTLTLTLAVA